MLVLKNSAKSFFAFALFFGLFFLPALSEARFFQEEDSVTDEELIKYMDVMDEVADLKAQAADSLNAMVKADKVITGKRYNELSKGETPTEEEAPAWEALQAGKEAVTAWVQSESRAMIMDNERLGAAVYNKVRKALKADPKGMKARMAVLRESFEDDEENVD